MPNTSFTTISVFKRFFGAADSEDLKSGEGQSVTQADQLRRVNSSLRELAARLLQIQDEERRRIARDLHDSLGQMLVAQRIYLSSVLTESEQLSPAAAKALEDSAALIDQMSREVRTISYVLHPPLLDEVGLVSAIRCYVEGFAERSKIKIEMDLTTDLGRLTSDFEIAMFRMVQECLTNIHRHSGSPTATILLSRSVDGITLEVRDAGKGIVAEKRKRAKSGKLTGVGLRGMRERITQLGGVVKIQTSSCGTAVIARLPIPNVSGSQLPAAQP